MKDTFQGELPLARTVASLLNSTTCILLICAAIRLVVVPLATSHRKTERSPPDDANLALSWELSRTYEISLVKQKEGWTYTVIDSTSYP